MRLFTATRSFQPFQTTRSHIGCHCLYFGCFSVAIKLQTFCSSPSRGWRLPTANNSFEYGGRLNRPHWVITHLFGLHMVASSLLIFVIFISSSAGRTMVNP